MRNKKDNIKSDGPRMSNGAELQYSAKEVEGRYRLLFDNFADSITVLSLDGIFLLLNKKGADNLGGKPADFIGKSIYKILPEAKPLINKQINQIVRSGQSVENEKLVKLPKGERWFWSRSSPVKDADGRIVAMQVISYDITSLKDTQKKATEERDNAKKYLDIAGVIIIALDQKGNIILINQKGCRILGYKHYEELVGKNWFNNFISKKARKDVRDVFGKLMEGRIKLAEYYENPVLAKDGNEKIIAWHNSLLKDDKGNIIGTLSSGSDITDKKMSEENLLKEKRFADLLINSTPGVFYLFDKKGNFLRWNKNFEKVTGYSSEEVKKLGALDHIVDEDKQHVADRIRETFVKGYSSVEATILTKGGTKIPYFLTGERVTIDGGAYLVGMGVDITERKQAELVLRDNESRYHSLFDNSPVSLWEEDFSNVKVFLDSLREKGVKDFREYFDKNPGAIVHCAIMIKVIDVNNAALELCEGTSKQSLRSSLRMIFGKESYDMLKQELIAISEGRNEFETDAILQTLKGHNVNIRMRWSVAPGYEDSLGKVFMSAINITARKRAQAQLEVLNKELIKNNKRLGKLVLMDSHTGVYNHRYFDEAIEREFSRAKRYAHPLSLLMLDIDYFKSINDLYGHKFGDLILKQFARQLKKMVRRYDIVIRFGGEEFIIICPSIDISTATILSQRILDAVNLYNFGDKKHIVKLKLSIAIASYPEDKIVKSMDLIDLADKILTKTKEDGGGRVYSYFDIANGKSYVSKDRDEAKEVKHLKGKLDKLNKESNQNIMESVLAFAKTIELKDRYTGEHVESTVKYASGIAVALNLSREEVELIKQAAVLHDLGKVGISEKILLKKSKLNVKETEEIRRHPQIAADIIRPLHFLHKIVPLILYHHERWDGKGYPTGLKGEEIPVGARIICIADVYQALISNRPYRNAHSEEKAIEIMKDGSGTQFDPKIVNTFLHIIKYEK